VDPVQSFSIDQVVVGKSPRMRAVFGEVLLGGFSDQFLRN